MNKISSTSIAQVAASAVIAAKISKNDSMWLVAFAVHVVAYGWALYSSPNDEPPYPSPLVNASNAFTAAFLGASGPPPTWSLYCGTALIGCGLKMPEKKDVNRRTVCSMIAQGCLGMYSCWLGRKVLSYHTIFDLGACLLAAGVGKLAAHGVRALCPKGYATTRCTELMEDFASINTIVFAGGLAGLMLNYRLSR